MKRSKADRARRASVAGALALGFILSSCERPQKPPPAPTKPVAVAAPAPDPAPVTPPSVLTRKDLIAAAAEAADAYAAGLGPPEALQRLAGRRFRLSVPFNCPGLQPPDPPAEVKLDSGGRALVFTVHVARWSKPELEPEVVPAAGAPTGDATAGEAKEELEGQGVWLARPWTSAETCPRPIEPAPPQPVEDGDTPKSAGPKPKDLGLKPKTRPAPESTAASKTEPLPAPSPPQTLALVEVLTGADSRLRRAPKSGYRATAKVEDAPDKATAPYRLVLEGRLVSRADGASGTRVVRCTGDSPLARPRCLVFVSFDRLAVRSTDGEAPLAEWPT